MGKAEHLERAVARIDERSESMMDRINARLDITLSRWREQRKENEENAEGIEEALEPRPRGDK